LEDEDGDCGMAANGDDSECSKANYREVGHNIYILAHQVFHMHKTLRYCVVTHTTVDGVIAE